jgi:hypothetical protein
MIVTNAPSRLNITAIPLAVRPIEFLTGRRARGNADSTQSRQITSNRAIPSVFQARPAPLIAAVKSPPWRIAAFTDDRSINMNLR